MASSAIISIDQDTNVNNSYSNRVTDSYNTNISRTFAPTYSDLGAVQVTFPDGKSNMGGSGGGGEAGGIGFSQLKKYLPALLLAVAVYWLIFRKGGR